MQEEALDRILWRNGLGRGYGSAIKQCDDADDTDDNDEFRESQDFFVSKHLLNVIHDSINTANSFDKFPEILIIYTKLKVISQISKDLCKSQKKRVCYFKVFVFQGFSSCNENENYH